MEILCLFSYMPNPMIYMQPDFILKLLTNSKRKATNRNKFGDPVEEYELQFIDGDDIDCELAKAIGLNQANIADYLICVEDWEYWEKINTIIAVGEGVVILMRRMIPIITALQSITWIYCVNWLSNLSMKACLVKCLRASNSISIMTLSLVI